MTVAVFASIKGAPGVTTLATLTAATWPAPRRSMVVECDPCGGDLAARFGLSSRRGWSSFATASRRAGSASAIAPHLQQLPGGLDVLIGARNPAGGDPARTTSALLSDVASDPDGPWDVVVDLGRLLPGGLSPGGWLDRCDAAIIVLRGDAASVLNLRDRAAALLDRCGDRVALAAILTGEYPSTDIAGFTGIPVVAEIPFDPAAAAVVAGGRGRGGTRRLARSQLVRSATRLAVALSGGDTAPPAPEQQADRARGEELEPWSTGPGRDVSRRDVSRREASRREVVR